MVSTSKVKSRVQGIISHKKLMELKNSGLVNPEVIHFRLQEAYDELIMDVANSLMFINGRFSWSRMRWYTVKVALEDAKLMFPDMTSLVSHLVATEGVTSFLRGLTDQDFQDLVFLHRCSLAAEDAKNILMCFKYADQVSASPEECANMDFLMYNAQKVREIISESDWWEERDWRR